MCQGWWKLNPLSEEKTERPISKLVAEDCHIHTCLSSCADKNMRLESVLMKAHECQLERIVILDHLWGREPAESELPNKLRESKKDLEGNFPSLEVKLSGEFNYDERLVREDLCDQFDFVTAGVHSLDRFGIFISNSMPVNILSIIVNKYGLKQILDFFLEQSVAMFSDNRVLVGAHPLNLYLYLEGVGYKSLDHMTKNASALHAVVKDKGFEINGSMFKRVADNLQSPAPRTFGKCMEAYARVLENLAPHVGFFTLASDAHSISEIGQLSYCDKIIEMAGIRGKISNAPIFDSAK
jgi:histidinol phosphatase-like PHP family hydrolase